ncbi:tetratricopeptide (TPR) repeat protein [Paenibacillus phyllosphaerae]|uniref:Tetratricopeptide (TPR) repeat protein n=1 Tax=Paenibacillus phyllosphaerae TaxID=274593 RepID=A0A7W5AWA7_9BACL|nr:tetratricopeptide (TPR) repeat protein [Paenibacillus phyllosphaerae]
MKKAYESILNGDYEQAIAWFEQAIELEPNQAAHHYKCSITCARSGKWQKALSHALQAVQLDEAKEEYRFQLQTVQAKLLVTEAEAKLGLSEPDTDAAIEKLKTAAKLDPLNVDALLLLGAVYASLDCYDEAADFAKEAMRLDPMHSAAIRLFDDVQRKRQRMRRIIVRKRKRKNR